MYAYSVRICAFVITVNFRMLYTKTKKSIKLGRRPNSALYEPSLYTTIDINVRIGSLKVMNLNDEFSVSRGKVMRFSVSSARKHIEKLLKLKFYTDEM